MLSIAQRLANSPLRSPPMPSLTANTKSKSSAGQLADAAEVDEVLAIEGQREKRILVVLRGASRDR